MQAAATPAHVAPTAAPASPPGLDAADFDMGVEEDDDPIVKAKKQAVDRANAQLQGCVAKRRRVNEEATQQQQHVDAESAKLAADLAAAPELSVQQAAAEATALEQELAAHKAAREAASAVFVQASQESVAAAATPTANGVPAAATPTGNGASPMDEEENGASQENLEGNETDLDSAKGKGKGENSRHSPM